MSRLKKGGRHTEATKGVADHDDEPSNCIICLERVSCRGKLSVCNHWFCFPCILEWAENTNTCPICKARFRCITKVHVSPFKSPPTKVRVGDKDQRVWNDDDDLVADDVLDAIDSDDLDDDYQPSVHVNNPWTRTLQNRGRQQGHNVQRVLSQTSRQLQLDQYDLEDSFIDDTDEALQAYLYSAYSRDDDYFDDVDNVVVEEDNESGTGETDDGILPQRVSPYILRNSHLTRSRSPVSAVNSIDRALQDIEEQLYASPASTNSFIASDDESADELNSDWVPFGNHSKNSRNNCRTQIKTRKQDCKRTTRAQKSGPSSTRSRRSQRLKTQQETEQTSISDEFQQPTSSRVRELNDQSAGGWINMAQKQAKANASTSTSSSYPRTRQRTSTSMQRAKNITRKGKKPLKHKESVNYDSSSDSEVEVLKDCSNHQEKPHRTACRVSNTRNKPAKTFSPKLKQNQEHLSPVLTSAHLETCNDASGESAQDDNYSDTMIIQPTPCSKTTRSIFTKRRHRPPIATSDHSEDAKPHQHSRSQADTSLSLKSSLRIQLSPVIKMRSQKRKRVIMSITSDSD